MKPLPGQTSFLDAPRTARQEHDVPLNSTVIESDVTRLNAQHRMILDRLREGPVTNMELGGICQRFGARLHELRQAGFVWTKKRLTLGESKPDLRSAGWKYTPGVWEYRLLDRGEG